jgi:8-oxo-dGTP pyrophosphatase MutT (NUDIX family)
VTVQFDPTAPPATPRDAATVVLVRDNERGELEVFYVKRHGDARFMGGAYVFPGGKLDEADRDAAVPTDLSPNDAAQRLAETDDPSRSLALFVAAARECLEEAGVLFAKPVDVARNATERLRHACNAEHRPLGELLRAESLTLHASALRPLARWITPRGETRRYDTRFFIAAVPSDTVASHDESETVASAWLTPREALARAERNEIVLAPPTHRTTEILAIHASAATALRAVPERPPIVEPVVAFTDAGAVIVALPGDPLHGSAEAHMVAPNVQLASLPTRFLYDNGAWRPARAG